MAYTFRGAGSPLLPLVCMLSKSRRKWFCGGSWVPSLETDAVLDAALSGDCFTMAIGVSVRAVQEKCDEKEQVGFDFKVDYHCYL